MVRSKYGKKLTTFGSSAGAMSIAVFAKVIIQSDAPCSSNNFNTCKEYNQFDYRFNQI